MQIQTRKEANHEIKRYTFSLHLFLILMLKNPVFYVFYDLKSLISNFNFSQFNEHF